MAKPTSAGIGQPMTCADVEQVARSVLHLGSVPFTSVAITAVSSGWKVLVYDGTTLMLRVPVLAGPATSVRQAIVDAVEAVW